MMFKQHNLEYTGLSDEVESGVLLFEASVRLWRLVSTSTSFSDKGSKSMSISDG
jgi:hypothetical protein